MFFFVTHANSVLVVLVIVLLLIFVVTQWRERRLGKQLEDVLSPLHQDILLQALNKQKSQPPKVAVQFSHQALNNKQNPQVFDTEFIVLRQEVEARYAARKKD